ncbi:MAG TPA: extracellular solute-binding protein [Candidatus Binatia bacterium]|jgi:iron(III) transport system substrate-binding protein
MRHVPILLALLLGFGFASRAAAQSEDELVRGAKKEGQVVFWSSMRIEDSRALVAGFEAKYPFLKVDIFRAGGEQIVNRAIAEDLSGKPTYDVLNAFALKVIQNRGLLQPYAAPEAAHYAAGFKDPHNNWVSLYSGYNVIGYNSKLVSKAEAPRNWEDLLAPRWKGKLGMDNEEYFWHAGMLQHWGAEKGKKYMDALSRQDLQFRNGHALLSDLMSVGEFQAVVVVYPDQMEQMKAKGQPVEWVKTTDPILVNLAPVGIAAKAPHPNAGKLFMNYSISREGQNILQKTRRASARLDVAPLVPDMDPRKLKLVPLDAEIPTNTEHVKDFRRAFNLN